MKRILPLVLAVILILSAIGHAFAPEFYAPMIPDFIPEGLANIATMVLEAGIGILLLLPTYRHLGGLGFMVLMIGFLPIHTWDMLRETPAIGPPPAPIIRFLFQFVLIYAG
ncbi:MAG: hypothetical protein AAGI38_25115, partial [Bacteroidota bacterium]